MSFKLGQRSGVTAVSGRIIKPHDFSADITIEHAKLEDGVAAEAVSSDKIIIDEDIPKGSALYRRAEAHEKEHAKEMGDGTIEYGDDYIRDGNQTYHRYTNTDGKDVVMFAGKELEVGSIELPWEQRAIKAENRT